MPDGSLIQYILDGQGLRLGKKVNEVFTERYLYDDLGSPKLVVDLVDDSVVEEISYDEFGNVTMDSNPGLQTF